ncbi:3-isopropylmalate dehydratase large subunit [Petroclostridium xylanilyticum]|uniref:3-isopropylmalate dehydratase large subunit n=1 Tax=Petroclostridium xylanilyticum TaxID=1792311 RepID=UPI000B97ECCA|nr:3-isopropylmalate dehydratase large subunit [Petroclostridium xylanilyticum]
MHAIEKILARASGNERVAAGEIVTAKVDMAEVNDLYLQVVKSFKEMGGQKVKHPDKVCFVLDHYAPAPTIQSATNQKAMREFVQEQGIKYLFDINEGVCHQVMPEAGIVFPGMVLVATDSHTTTHGAFGAFGTGVGATDLATILISGELWFRVPEVIKIQIDGIPQKGTSAKDIVLHIIGKLGPSIAVYKAIEYCGSTVENMSIDERMVLCNMAVEMGAKTSYIQPDDKTMRYIKSKIDREFEIFTTDKDYKYAKEYYFNVADLTPQVAKPDNIDDVDGIDNVDKVEVHQAFIGTCTGGRLEDIEVAVQILKGKTINPRTRLVVIPASKGVYLQAVQKGYIEELIKAGATISAPGCGPCLGAHQGVLAPGEYCVTTSSRNFPGRMGSTEAKIFCVSPATAAATALEGRLADPRKYILMEE